LRWSAPDRNGQNGQIIEYVVRWKAVHELPIDDELDDDDGIGSKNRPNAVKVQSSSMHSQELTITGLNSYTLYRVTVAAATNQGIGPDSAPADCRTDEDGLLMLLLHD
jgi:hypothetical protein